MKNTEANITLYNIDRCGYFSRSSTEALFCSPTDLLNELKNWAQNKNLSETALHNSDDKNEYDIPPVYLFDIQNKDSVWIISSWNEVPSTEAGVPSISKTSKVGNAKIHSNQIVDNTIPGYPTYFCFFPEKKLFGTICFKQRVNGQQGLKGYLNNFLTYKNDRYIQKEIKTDSDGIECTINNYINPYGGTPEDFIYPRYETKLYKKQGNEKFLLRNVSKINKIITRKTITIEHDSEVQNLQSKVSTALRFLTGIPEESLPNFQSQRFESIFDIYFETPSELQSIIDSWYDQANDTYNDYGFKLIGDSQNIHWLSSSMAKNKFLFNLSLDENGIVSAESLLQEVIRYKEQILRLQYEK